MAGARDRTAWRMLAAVALVAAAFRLAYWLPLRGSALDAWHLWSETDMAFYLEHASQIAAGDWLQSNPPRPYNAWQEAAGPREEWERWSAPHVFHQAPLYAYALALLSRFSGHFIGFAKGIQLLLGVGTATLVAWLGLRMGGIAAGAIAGGLVALYGPLVYLEAQLLREGPALFGLAAVVALAVAIADERPGADARARAQWTGPFALGLVLGVLLLLYEMATLFAMSAAVVVAVSRIRRSARSAAVALAALAAGWLIGFSPLLARNIAVGAPPLAVSTRVALNLAIANRPGAAGGGVLFVAPGPDLLEIMEASRGTVTGVVRELWRRHEGRRSRVILNGARRFSAVWADVELPDNTSWDFYRREVPVLRLAATFRWLFAPAAAVVLLLAMRAIPRAPLALPLLAFAAPLVAALSAVHPQGRYRLFLLPLLAPLAASFAAALARWTRERAWTNLAAVTALGLALALLQLAVSAPLR